MRSTAVLIHGRDIETTLTGICEAIVAESPYRAAAVGLVEPGDGEAMRIAAKAGPASDYFSGLRLSQSEAVPEGRGPAGIALRCGEACVVDDALSAEIFAPWRDRALRFDLRAILAMPLLREAKRLGVLIVYAGEAGAFGPEERALFQHLGDEIAFALALDADRLRLAAAESDRRASEARYALLFDAAASGILVATPEGVYIEANPAMHRLLGYEPPELIGLSAADIVPPEEIGHIEPALAQIRQGQAYERTWRFRRKDGDILTAEVTASTLPDGAILAVVRDISQQVKAETARDAAEQALRDSEARYRSLFDNAPEGLVLISADGPYLDVNPSACKMLLYERQDLIGKQGRDLVDEADVHFLYEAADEIAQHGVTRRRWRLRRSDGTWVAAEVVSTQLPDGNYMSMITDLTERDAIEAEQQASRAALSESEARYRGLFDHAPDGIIVNSEPGPYVDINPSACAMLGYDRDAFIGLKVSDLVGEAQAKLHSEALTSLADRGIFRAAWRARRRDGSWIPTEVVTTQLPDKTYISIIRDVTERERAETARAAAQTALVESEGRYRGLFDHAPDGLIVIAENGVYLDINPSACALLGYRREDFVGLSGPDLVGEAQAHKLREAAETIAAEGVYRDSWRLRRKDGSWVSTEVVTTQMPDKTYVSIIRDVTERDRIEAARIAAEDALRETQAKLSRAGRAAALGEVATTIAHEINQPLAAIVTNSDAAQRWLARDPPDLEQANQSLNLIVRDSRRASQVIRRTRDFLGGKGLIRAPFDLNAALQEVMILSRTEQRRAGVVTRILLDPELPLVDGDRTQLQQVALNIVLNALDAMSPTDDTVRRLTLTTSRHDADWALVEIEDCGPGLIPETLEHVFDQFFTTKGFGTGVGLSISRSIIEAHGGRIWADSAATGGAVFRFTAPLARGEGR